MLFPPSHGRLLKDNKRGERAGGSSQNHGSHECQTVQREVNLGEQQEVAIRQCRVLNCLRDTSGTQEQEEELGTDG